MMMMMMMMMMVTMMEIMIIMMTMMTTMMKTPERAFHKIFFLKNPSTSFDLDLNVNDKFGE